MLKRHFFLYVAVSHLAACSTFNPSRVELSDWQFEYQDHLFPASVPGFIHTDLIANNIIPDPYYGTNEDSVRWVADSVWTYTMKLDRSLLPEGDSLWIVFEGVAGHAEVVFCGAASPGGVGLTEMHEMDNMFVQYVFPLPDFTEEILVQFHPLHDSCLEAEYGIPLPDRRAFTRIAPYQQGWDWGPKMPSCGIWKPVYITNSSQSRESRQSRQSRESRESRQSRIEFRQEPDSIGQSFSFYRDGKPLFIKGANWIPVHSFPVDDNANRTRYRTLLCSAKEAGFNMLRVWGGGIYEHDYFFDLCDSLDIMVWMDFNFSTMLYPDNPQMLESIREEAYQNVTRIAKHHCIVLWCGNNEVKNGWEDWGWQGVYNWTPEQRAHLEKAMDTIFGYPSASGNSSSTSILAQAVRDCDPYHRPYITTSPLYGWGHPECVTHGDSHYWGVWWGEEPFEKYKEKTGRFMSEFGFQSYPMMSTIRRFCPEDQLYIDSPTMRSHQKHGRGREIIDKAMMQYYGFDSKSLPLEDYVYVSQLLQAWGTGYGIFCHIINSPQGNEIQNSKFKIHNSHCMGTLYWQLNDCWPVASWSSIDYYGNWKALHYRVQSLYDNNVDLAKWERYYSVYPKDRAYKKAKFNSQFTIHNSQLKVTVTAQSDLYDIYIDTEPHIDGHFSSNFFDLKTGEKKTVTFIPVAPSADLKNVKVTVRTLNELYSR